MKFYLAAAYGRKEEIKRYRDELKGLGYDCTSSWLDVLDEVTDFASDDHAQEYAVTDLNDISRADALVLFSENGQLSRGGRHVEFGFAYAHFKPIYIVGGRELIFHSLPGIHVYSTWQEFLEAEADRKQAFSAVKGHF